MAKRGLTRKLGIAGPILGIAMILGVALLILPIDSFAGVAATHSLAIGTPVTLGWTKLAPIINPGNKSGIGLAYDVKDGYVVLFGGAGGGGRGLNQTWTYSGGIWTEIFPNSSPPAGSPVAMAYDNATQQIIFYGGWRQHNSLSSGFWPAHETWAFSGGTWTHLLPRHSPPILYPALMTYDPTIRATLLYGHTYRPWWQHPRTFTPTLETWVYKGGDWTRPNATLLNTPTIAAIAYDPQYRGDIGLGQVSATNSTTATWLFKNGNWSRVSTPTEPASNFQTSESGVESMVYDAVHGFLLLTWPMLPHFTGAAAEHSAKFNNGHWTGLAPSTVPRSRWFYGMTFDTRDGYVMQYGGRANGGLTFNQTWIY